MAKDSGRDVARVAVARRDPTELAAGTHDRRADTPASDSNNAVDDGDGPRAASTTKDTAG